MRNRCDFFIMADWRFNNGMRLKQQFLGPSQSYIVNCGQLSDQCDGGVIAYGEKIAKLTPPRSFITQSRAVARFPRALSGACAGGGSPCRSGCRGGRCSGCPT